MKLKHLKIKRFRNVKPGTELHFSDEFNIILGRNGTGSELKTENEEFSFRHTLQFNKKQTTTVNIYTTDPIDSIPIETRTNPLLNTRQTEFKMGSKNKTHSYSPESSG